MEPIFLTAGDKLYNVFQIVSLKLKEPNYVVTMSNGKKFKVARTNPVLERIVSGK